MLSDKAKTEPSEGLFWFLNFAIGSGIESEEDEPGSGGPTHGT